MSHWVSGDIAARYRAFRPTYPRQLFEVIEKAFNDKKTHHPQQQQLSSSSASPRATPPPAVILDVGCGSGQAIQGLAQIWPQAKFIGLDPSEAQLKEAKGVLLPRQLQQQQQQSTSSSASTTTTTTTSRVPPHLDVSLVHGDAGNASVMAKLHEALAQQHQPQQQQVSLVTVAQALHWIDIPKFASNLLSRGSNHQSSSTSSILHPTEGLLAAWLYTTTKIISNTECNNILARFDQKLLTEGYWPKERWHIENHYRDQIQQLEASGFSFVGKQVVADERTSSLDDFMLYLSTWSGLQKYIAATKREDALDVEVRKPMVEALTKERGSGSTRNSPTPNDDDVRQQQQQGLSLKLRFEFELFLFRPVVGENSSKL